MHIQFRLGTSVRRDQLCGGVRVSVAQTSVCGGWRCASVRGRGRELSSVRVAMGARVEMGARKCLAAIVPGLAAVICGLDIGGEKPQTEVCATWGCAPLLGLLLIFAAPASATTYFVAAAGSDSNSGTSSGTPWQTVAKVNGATFSPGDSILFNRGDVWYGTALTVPSSRLERIAHHVWRVRQRRESDPQGRHELQHQRVHARS